MSNSSRKEVIFAGVDDGYAETKITLSNGTKIKIPSQAKAGEMNQISINGGSSSIYSYTTNDGDFIIGDISESDPTAFDDYPISAMNRVIVHHALRRAGLTGDHEVRICTGLPVKRYYIGGIANKRLINLKRQNLLMTDVGTKDGQSLCLISKHDVLAEGIAAYMDIVLEKNEHGRILPNQKILEERIAIIDIGGRTTDVAVIKKNQLDTSRSSTIDVGMLAVRDSLSNAIHGKFEVHPNNEQLNEAMSKKKLKLWGKEEAVGDLVDTAIISQVARIKAEVKKCLKDASDIDRVVFVGGTVVEIENHLNGWFKQQSIGFDPSFANARGMQKYAEMLQFMHLSQ